MDLTRFEEAGRKAARNNERRNAWATDIVQEYADENPEVGSGTANAMMAWFDGYDEEKVNMMLEDALD